MDSSVRSVHAITASAPPQHNTCIILYAEPTHAARWQRATASPTLGWKEVVVLP